MWEFWGQGILGTVSLFLTTKVCLLMTGNSKLICCFPIRFPMLHSKIPYFNIVIFLVFAKAGVVNLTK